MNQQKNQKFVNKNLHDKKSEEKGSTAENSISSKNTPSQDHAVQSLEIETLKNQIESLEKQIVELTEKLATAETQKNDYFGKFQRVGADFENFKKRSANERSVFSKMAIEPFVRSFFPVFDAFDIAIKSIPSEFLENSWLKGILEIREKMIAVFISFGVILINPEKNSDFDPNFSESLSVEKIEGIESNKILEVYQIGFKLGEKILRPARVKVSG